MSQRIAFASRSRRLLAPLVIVLLAVAAGCAEIGTDPAEAVSIEFNRLPSPSILIGDTLRDLEGDPVVLRDSVWVFNQSNDTIDYPVRFVATVDTSRIRWDEASGYLVSDDSTGLRTVGIQAQAGALFPPAVSLAIVPGAPTTIDTVDSDADPIFINFLAGAMRQRSSEEVAVRVRAGDSLVNAWPVQFLVVTLPPSLDSARFVGTAADTMPRSRASPYDTTASGNASRLVIAWRKAGAAAGTDTLVVRARIRVRREVRDSVEWRIPVVIQAAAP